MKKRHRRIWSMVMLCILMALMLAAAPAAVAFAADEGTATAEITLPAVKEFMTWAVAGTYTGCLILTIIMTWLFKKYWPQKWDTRLLSYIFALLIILAASWALKTLTLENAVLALLNAGLITAGANGSYEWFNKGSDANAANDLNE